MKSLRAAASFLLLSTLGLAADPAALKAAVELFNQRKADDARQAFEALAAADPRDAEVQFYLGRLALQRDAYEQSVGHLEKAVALAPGESRYQHRLGDAYGRSAQKASLFSQMGLAKKCKAAYEKAVELDPRNLEARQSLLGYYLQAPAIVGGGTDKALVQAEAVKQLNPARGRQLLAQVYNADKKYDLMFAQFDEVLKDSPDDYTSLYQVGRFAAASGQALDRGLACLRRCLALPVPDGEPGHAAAHWRIGNILEKQNDKAGARAAYEAALKTDPKFTQAADALKKL